MNGLITSSVIGTGYNLNKDGKNSRKKDNSNNLFRDKNNQFVYNSNYYDNVKNKESSLANRNFFNARNAIQTNIIPGQFNNKIINNSNLPGFKNDKNDNNLIIKSKLREEKSIRIILHITIKYLFLDKVRQNINIGSNQLLLKTSTGMSSFNKSKREQTPLFEPTKI